MITDDNYNYVSGNGYSDEDGNSDDVDKWQLSLI